MLDDRHAAEDEEGGVANRTKVNSNVDEMEGRGGMSVTNQVKNTWLVVLQFSLYSF